MAGYLSASFKNNTSHSQRQDEKRNLAVNITQIMQFNQIITGAAGFVGKHLCRQLAATSLNPKVAVLDLLPTHQKEITGKLSDIRSAAMLSQLTDQWSAPVVIHLAALAEVVMPFEMMSDLNATNVQGTINILEAFNPKRFVFASSSAVYGSVRNDYARPLPDETAAIGIYGVSKVMGEVICSEWAAEYGSTSVALRFGNIIGPGCRGLIPYLVSHALKYPDASVPTRLRGQGRIVRDYVPVECAVDAILKAPDLPLDDGQSTIFNIGSGYGLTNGEVAHKVAEVLSRKGYQLDLNFDNPIPAGESESVILDISDTADRLGVNTPTKDEVTCSIEQATLWHIELILQQQSDS